MLKKTTIGLVAIAIAGSLVAGPAERKPVTPDLDLAKARSLERDGTRIHFQRLSFDPVREYPDFSETGIPTERDSRYAIVQFEPGSLVSRRDLQARGVEFLGYIPDHAYRVRLTPEAKSLLNSHSAVRAIIEYEPGFKIDSRIWPGAPDIASGQIFVSVFPGESIREVTKTLGELFPEIVVTHIIDDTNTPRARITISYRQRDEIVAAVASMSTVVWIEPYFELQLHNINASGPIQGNAPGEAGRAIFAQGLTGTGQIVAVVDSGNDSDHCAFKTLNGVTAVTDFTNTAEPAIGPLFPDRKVIGYWVQKGADAYDDDATCPGGTPTGFHGTHTSGSAVGDNPATPSSPTNAGVDDGDGMAPNAQLLFQDIGASNGCLSGSPDPADTYTQARDGGARIHSNSYGSGTFGVYGISDLIADQWLFDNEEMAIFFSAGNDGPSDMSVGSPGNAKNVVTVGALGNGDSTQNALFSSHGPTLDGRIKPDIMASGTGIRSAGGTTSHSDANCLIFTKQGTSMSTPIVAGGAALLRQYFTDGYYPSGSKTDGDAHEPTASLVKAVLLNGTRPLPDGATFGNIKNGWGRIFLDNNLYFPGDARKSRVWSIPNSAGMDENDIHTYTVNVAEGEEFRVTLVWADPEPSLGATFTLVNDLDLTVSNGSSTWKGNVFNEFGVSVTGGSKDVLNNVEHVRFTAPASGTYTIQVHAKEVPGNGRFGTDRQGYALVASNAECGSSVASTATGLAATTNPTLGIDLYWTPAPGSSVTQIYRAPAGTTDSAKFQYIGSSNGSSFTDKTAVRGDTWVYRVRGADSCGEGPASESISFSSTGGCDTDPEFAGITSVTANRPDCSITIAWDSASPRCSFANDVVYNVYRSTEKNFVPSNDPIATVTTTSYTDVNVASGLTYHYVVRAEDDTGGGSGPNLGNEDGNFIRAFATPSGSAPSGSFVDDAGDTTALLSLESPWKVSTAQAQSGSSSYLVGTAGGTYPADTCASATSPSFEISDGSVLSYWVRYVLEIQWDGVVVEISSDGGTNWTDLPPDGGYPSNFGQTGEPPVNVCGYPASQGAFNGPRGHNALTVWSEFTTDLSAYAGKTAMIRWRFSSDPGLEFEGLYLDTISVTTPGPCVEVTVTPEADFEIGTRSIVTGTPVQFTDLSTNGPTTWMWDFGDGTISTLRNPTHTFALPGEYTVTLTTSNGAGGRSAARAIEVFDSALVFTPRAIAPGQARAKGGNNSFFKSAFWMTNPTTETIFVRITFVPAPFTPTGGADESVIISIAPNESVAYRDVLSDALGATDNAGGSILIEGVESSALPIITTRTYNEPGPFSGTFGQYIPAVILQTTGGEAIIDGLGADTAFRTNVGVVNLGDTAITATLTVHDTSGIQRGQMFLMNVPARSAVQVPATSVTGAGTLAVFSAKVTAVGDFFVYASKADNVTSDPIYVPSTLVPRSRQWIDGVGALPGGGGTFFRSNLAIANRNGATASVTLIYTPWGSTAPTHSRTISVGAGETVFYKDVVTELFEASGAGTLTVTTGESTPVLAWARTFNDRGLIGTLGQFIPAFGPESLLGSAGAILQGLSQDTGIRTNMGIINVGDADASLTVSVWSKDGVKRGEKIYPVLAGQSRFVGSVMADIVAAADITDGYLRVTPSTPGSLYVWTSYVDLRSTDQTFVTPIAIP